MLDLREVWFQLGGGFQETRMHYGCVTCGTLTEEGLQGPGGALLLRVEELQELRDRAHESALAVVALGADWGTVRGHDVRVDAGVYEFRKDGYLVAVWSAREALVGRCLKSPVRGWVAGSIDDLRVDLELGQRICQEIRFSGERVKKLQERRDQLTEELEEVGDMLSGHRADYDALTCILRDWEVV